MKLQAECERYRAALMRIATGTRGNRARYPGATELTGPEAVAIARRALWHVEEAREDGGRVRYRDSDPPDGWQPDAEDVAAWEQLVRER